MATQPFAAAGFAVGALACCAALPARPLPEPEPEPEPEPPPEPELGPLRPRPKKSAKKWQQLRDKRTADSRQRASTAASYDPVSTQAPPSQLDFSGVALRHLLVIAVYS